MRPVWNEGFASCWPTKSPATWSACGCWFPSTSAWEPGTCCRAGAANRTPRVEPRLALQLVHEAALCVTGVRQSRCLSQKGFELLNGLPFVATDQAIHHLLEAHTVAEAEALQKNLGWLRRARGHFQGQLLAIDPHRTRSYSKRLMCRYRADETSHVVAPWNQDGFKRPRG